MSGPDGEKPNKNHFECPSCFLIFEDHETNEPNQQKNCDWCANQLKVFEKILAERLVKRRIEVMRKTSICRFPEVIRDMFYYLEGQR